MKKATIIIVACLCFTQAKAQKVIDKHMSFTGKESVTMKIQIADSIGIHTWNKNEVYVKASVNINNNKDNDAYETSFNDAGNEVSVKANFRDNYFRGRNNCCNETEIYWDIYIPANTMFSVETINGNVTVTGQTREMQIKSISGYIDLAAPANTRAELDFSTISGRIYTNHDIDMVKRQGSIPMKVSAKMNNGTDRVRLETISGDIFFRKADQPLSQKMVAR